MFFHPKPMFAVKTPNTTVAIDWKFLLAIYIILM